jgi:hypothetical protein
MLELMRGDPTPYLENKTGRAEKYLKLMGKVKGERQRERKEKN